MSYASRSRGWAAIWENWFFLPLSLSHSTHPHQGWGRLQAGWLEAPQRGAVKTFKLRGRAKGPRSRILPATASPEAFSNSLFSPVCFSRRHDSGSAFGIRREHQETWTPPPLPQLWGEIRPPSSRKQAKYVMVDEGPDRCQHPRYLHSSRILLLS